MQLPVSRSHPPEKWQFTVLQYTQSEVQDYCTNDPEWQRFRNTLKGIPTTKKLEMLRIRRACILDGEGTQTPTRRCVVQCDNYINSLKRGGQLNMKLEVVK